MLVDLSAATLGAPQSALDIDVAELLVACTVLVGPERALAQGRRGRLARRRRPRAAVPPARGAHAASPRPRARPRGRRSRISGRRGGRATGQEVPEIVPMRRIRPRDFLLDGDRGVRRVPADHAAREDRLRHDRRRAAPARARLDRRRADPRPARRSSRRACRCAARCATPLPLLPCVVLQSAIKFINLTVPSSAGRIGINVRFLQRMGAPTPRGRRRRRSRRHRRRRSSRSRSCWSRFPSSTSRSTRAT